MSMQPLTDEQRTLVVENRGLVYSAVYKMMRSGKLLPHLHDDAIGEGMIGLMKAAALFDPSRGYKFSTLAMISIRRQILNYIEKEINQTKLNAISLDVPNESREGETIGEVLPARDDVESEAVEWLMDAVELMSKNHPKAKCIETLIEYMSGRTMLEMAEERGVTKQRIQAMISEAKRVLRKGLDRSDWF